jgi:hypothetical protein
MLWRTGSAARISPQAREFWDERIIDMKRTKTKLLSVFLSVCMVFTCMIGLSATASATSYDPYTVFSGLVQSIKQGDTINGSWRDEEGMYANGELVTIKPAGGGADIATRAVNWTAAADYNITACDYTVYDSYDGNLGPYEDQYGDYMEVLIYEFIFTVESAAPTQPTVAVSPNADAGSVNMEYDSEENAWACTAVPATGYKFVKWTFDFNGSSGEHPFNSIMLSDTYIDSFTNITAVFDVADLILASFSILLHKLSYNKYRKENEQY